MLYKNPCVDCAETTVGIYRGQRGGEYLDGADFMTTARRAYNTPTDRSPMYGFRCARARP